MDWKELIQVDINLAQLEWTTTGYNCVYEGTEVLLHVICCTM